MRRTLDRFRGSDSGGSNRMHSALRARHAAAARHRRDRRDSPCSSRSAPAGERRCSRHGRAAAAIASAGSAREARPKTAADTLQAAILKDRKDTERLAPEIADLLPRHGRSAATSATAPRSPSGRAAGNDVRIDDPEVRAASPDASPWSAIRSRCSAVDDTAHFTVGDDAGRASASVRPECDPHRTLHAAAFASALPGHHRVRSQMPGFRALPRAQVVPGGFPAIATSWR